VPALVHASHRARHGEPSRPASCSAIATFGVVTGVMVMLQFDGWLG